MTVSLWPQNETLRNWDNEQLDNALKASDEMWIDDFIKRLNYSDFDGNTRRRLSGLHLQGES